ncbi:MAG: VPLPA-CTERM sorting domain-containing protein [Pseudomonadota bacterium]
MSITAVPVPAPALLLLGALAGLGAIRRTRS